MDGEHGRVVMTIGILLTEADRSKQIGGGDIHWPSGRHVINKDNVPDKGKWTRLGLTAHLSLSAESLNRRLGTLND